MLGARPHSQELTTNSSTLAMNRRTWPKRCVSQPVSGTAMALATAKLVMTQVPCVELTPRSPEIAGSETLAIDVSSTFMKVAAESAIVPHSRAEPSSGGRGAGGAEAVAIVRKPLALRSDSRAKARPLPTRRLPAGRAVFASAAPRPMLAAMMRCTSASAPWSRRL